MMHKLRIGVIFGGRSGEYEVSLASARSILNALDPELYEVTQIGITLDGFWLSNKMGVDVIDLFSQHSYKELCEVVLFPSPAYRGLLFCKRPSGTGKSLLVIEPLVQLDVIFPVLHGTYGEDGTLQGLLELNDIAYVGAGVVGSAVGMDKAIFKSVMAAHQIPTVKWMLILKPQIEQDEEAVVQNVMDTLIHFPLFIKPANLGSSVGITKCNNRSELLCGLKTAMCYDRLIVVEEGINAREIEVSVLGNEEPIVSVPGEIIPSREFYSYQAKYLDQSSQLLIPAPLSLEMVEQVKSLALRAYRAVDCAGMARVDFLLDKESYRLYISEINTIPGFTDISMYPKLWEYSGIDYAQLVQRLIEFAILRRAEKERIRYRRDG